MRKKYWPIKNEEEIAAHFHLESESIPVVETEAEAEQ